MKYYVKNKYFGNIINKYLESHKHTFDNRKIDYYNVDYYNKQYCDTCMITNQFINISCLGNKKEQYNNLIKYDPKAINDYVPFTISFTKSNINQIKKYIKNNTLWIIKPENGTFRQGIFIVNSYDNLLSNIKRYNINKWICQKYIENPLLYNKHKFHFRIYVLVTKTESQINAYVYNEGFMYLSKFIYNYNNIDDSYLSGEDSPKQVRLFPQDFIKNFGYHKYKFLIPQINKIVNSSIGSVKKQILCHNSKVPDSLCYKLFGYDILIDNKFKLYLGEINGRLITFKYPPPLFKKRLYINILDLILKNNIENFSKVYTSNYIEYYLNINSNSKTYYCVVIVCLIYLLYKYIY